MTDVNLVNNLWVLICALLVFSMTMSVGLLEIGELGETYSRSLLKVLLITGSALFFMAFLGFNTAFAPTFGGIIGNPLYNGGIFLGGFSAAATGLLSGVWWSMDTAYFATGLTTGTYFLFETAFASVTLALVGVVVLKKMKLEAFLAFSVVYFILIWNLPAAWIWNPTGWLYLLGVRDFAGGLVVHGAAGAAGLAIVHRIWREEKKKGLTESLIVHSSVNPTWLTLAILLLWMGWFGFNPGSVLAFNSSAITVVLTTFLAAASALLSVMFFRYLKTKRNPDLIYANNGILMGLIVITPIAGFVSPGSAVILGVIAGPLYLVGEGWFGKRKWFSDPVGLFPGHLLGGLFGLVMIGFFTQSAFAAASGNANLPNGLLFGGGFDALHQLGLEAFAALVVMAVVFALSYATLEAIAWAMHGVTTKYKDEVIV
ncbi:MAG: ammonium transporter [Thaumarchaeota archaeon]|nr:ammonium transporter [Nitrososphaerota archaeon]